MDKPKLKQYWIEPAGDIELDLEVTEKEFGPWILATEAAPIYEEMWKEIETLREEIRLLKIKLKASHITTTLVARAYEEE